MPAVAERSKKRRIRSWFPDKDDAGLRPAEEHILFIKPSKNTDPVVVVHIIWKKKQKKHGVY